MKKYIYNALVGFDQFCNTVIGGTPDETISARAGRARKDGKIWGKAVSGALDWLQKDHVEGAIQGDMNRAETVEQTEEKYGAKE